MVPSPPANNRKQEELYALELLRKYGDIYHKDILSALKAKFPQSTENELYIVLSKMIDSGRIIRSKTDRLSIKEAEKPR